MTFAYHAPDDSRAVSPVVVRGDDCRLRLIAPLAKRVQMMKARRVAMSEHASKTTPHRTQRKSTRDGTEVPPQSA
jgi:hypothetical protein